MGISDYKKKLVIFLVPPCFALCKFLIPEWPMLVIFLRFCNFGI